MKGVGNYFVHLVYFTATSCIEWTFGTFCGHFGQFLPFRYAVTRQIWQPWLAPQNASSSQNSFDTKRKYEPIMS
jgi:hypothetical protein